MTLNDIAWSFSSIIYTSKEEFSKAITDYQIAIFQTDEKWKPNETAFDFPELQIQYEAWITGSEKLLNNETLLDEEDAFDEDNSDEGMFQVEIAAHLHADNGENFTALEFLFKTHNQLANKDLGDHVFFEGTDESPQIVDGLPLCYTICGS